MRFDSINSGKDRSEIFKLARKLKNESQDVIGENCIRGDDGRLVFDQKKLLEAWKTHYNKLFNEEFEWSPNVLSHNEPIQGPLSLSQRKWFVRQLLS